MSAARFQADLRVVEARGMGAGLHLLALALPGRDPGEGGFRAGQFAQLAVPGRALPRPFSILRSAAGRLEFLVKAVGPGTNWLAARRSGQAVPALWPLGRGFRDKLREDDRGETWLLVGGGVGIPPLIALKEQAGDRPGIELLFGHRDAATARAAALLHPGLEPHLATEDGSLGFAGRVTGLLKKTLDEHAAASPAQLLRIFCCGPDPMMEAVAALAKERSLPCLLSLETLMGCGIGICVGCAVPRAGGGFALACQEGPVFSTDELAAPEHPSPVDSACCGMPS